MKVKELIALLKQCNPDDPVRSRHCDDPNNERFAISHVIPNEDNMVVLETNSSNED